MYRQSEKLVKQQYLHMFSQYGELRPCNGWDRLVNLGHPSKFQWVLGLGFVTAPMLLNGGQPHFASCLAVSRAGTLHIHFWGLWSCPITEFCLVQNSLCVQVSYISSVTARHSSSGWQSNFVAWYKEWNYGLLLLIICNRGRHLYSEGGHHVGHRPTF